MTVDYIITDRTHWAWPGLLPYRGPNTKLGRGYRSYADASARLQTICAAYAARMGRQGAPDLRIIARERAEA